MTSIIATLKKVDWRTVWRPMATIGIVVTVGNFLVLGFGEQNGMDWFGVFALIIGLALFSKAKESDDPGQLYICAYYVSFAFFLLSPLLHIATTEKVWIVGDKTTLNTKVLLRSPFAPLATSILKEKNITIRSWAKTKDDKMVICSISGDFRLTDDENVVISRFSTMKDPDKEIHLLLLKILDGLYEKAVAQRNVSELATPMGKLALEVEISDAATTAVKQIGLKRNGSIVTSEFHPYFVDK